MKQEVAAAMYLQAGKLFGQAGANPLNGGEGLGKAAWRFGFDFKRCCLRFGDQYGIHFDAHALG